MCYYLSMKQRQLAFLAKKFPKIYDKFLKNGEKVLGPIVKEIMKI